MVSSYENLTFKSIEEPKYCDSGERNGGKNKSV